MSKKLLKAHLEGKLHECSLKYGWDITDFNTQGIHNRIYVSTDRGTVIFDYWPSTGSMWCKTLNGKYKTVDPEATIFEHLKRHDYKPIFN